jgi:hypothetical protein
MAWWVADEVFLGLLTGYRPVRYYTAHTVTPIKQLMKDALIKAARDPATLMFQCAGILDNSKELLKDLKFGVGRGTCGIITCTTIGSRPRRTR